MEVLVVGKRSAVSRGENHLPKTNPLFHFYACLALLYVVCVVLYRSLAILSDLKKHTHIHQNHSFGELCHLPPVTPVKLA